MCADFSLFPDIRAHPSSGADWLAIASHFPPHQGYGFATSVHVRTIANPPGDYPDPRTEHRAFSWELGPTHYAQALHLFRLHTSGSDLGDLAGRSWYDEIYKPLRARIIEE
ncbi:MAG TPA: hypothetical protein VJ276_07975 [Thermoanaerobaculia bacterium]|nr:hypothetical protein [Thermoanaerobaculia bacterium]